MNKISYFFQWLLNSGMTDNNVVKIYDCNMPFPSNGHLAMWTFLILLCAALLGTVYFYHVLCKDINKANLHNYWMIELITAVVMVVAYIVASILVTRDPVLEELLNGKSILATGTFWIVLVVALVYYAVLYWVISWLMVGLTKTNGKNILPFINK